MLAKRAGWYLLLALVAARRPDETLHSLAGVDNRYKAGTSAEFVRRIVSDISDYMEGEVLDRDQNMIDGARYMVLDQDEQLTDQLPLRTLNRHSFAENILRGTALGNYIVEQWMVRFCPASWHECQWQEAFFEDLAGDWEAKLNTDVSSRRVRFAMVDCATDKELCHAEGVMAYPTVHHYHKGKRLDAFDGTAGDFSRWLEHRLSAKKQEQQRQVDHLAQPNDSRINFGVLQVAAILAVNAFTICYNMLHA